MILSILEILFGEKSKPPPISFKLESNRVGILSTDKVGLNRLATSLSGLAKLNEGKIKLGETIWHEKNDLKSNLLISYLSNDWSFLSRLDFYEIYTLLKNFSRFSLPHFIQKSFRLKLAITQLLIAEAPIWILNQVDFQENIEEWTKFLSSFKDKIIIVFSDNSKITEKICEEVVIIDDSKVIEQAKIKELIEGLDGIVWQKNIDTADIDQYDESFFILKKEITNNKTLISVLSEKKPCEGFSQTQPSLEILFQHKIILNKLISE